MCEGRARVESEGEIGWMTVLVVSRCQCGGREGRARIRIVVPTQAAALACSLPRR